MDLGWGKTKENFSYGANLKIISSFLETYSSIGVAFDVALTYENDKKDMNVVILAKNIGTQLKSYATTKERLPFDLQMGISQQLEHLPLRIFTSLHHLTRWDIRYDDLEYTNENLFFGDTTQVNVKKFIFDKLMRHFVFGGELKITKGLDLRLAYNYLRRHELLVDSKRGSVGFSWGFGINIKRFRLDFSRSKYHLAGTTNNFSFAFKLNDGLKRKNKKESNKDVN